MEAPYPSCEHAVSNQLSPWAQRLTDAAIAGDLPAVEDWLQVLGTPPDANRLKDGDVPNAFFMAAAFNRAAVLQRLALALPQVDCNATYALQLAAANNAVSAVAWLLTTDADPKASQGLGLKRAAEKDYPQVIALLAPRVELEEVADQFIADQDWASLDRLGPYASPLLQATWRTLAPADKIPWLTHQVLAQDRDQHLSQMPPAPKGGRARPRS